MFKIWFKSKGHLYDRGTLKTLFPKLSWTCYTPPALTLGGKIRVVSMEPISGLYWDQEFEDALTELLAVYDVPLEEAELQGKTLSFYYVTIFPTLSALRTYLNRELLTAKEQPEFQIFSYAYDLGKIPPSKLLPPESIALACKKTIDVTDLVEKRDERIRMRFEKAGICKVSPC